MSEAIPGRDQRRALQWLVHDGTLKCFAPHASFFTTGGSVSHKVMKGLVDRHWVCLQQSPPSFPQTVWYATITDEGRKALERAP